MTRRIWKRFLANKAALFALILFALMIISCVIFPLLGYDDIVTLHLDERYVPVSVAHPFSTDHLGRDFFSRMMVGGRVTLGLSFLASSVSLIVGTLLGISAGYLSGIYDNITMRILEALSAIPYLLIAILAEVMLGWGEGWFWIAISLSNLPAIARNIRAAVLKVRNREFIEASRALNKSGAYILFHHILRNVYGSILVQFCSAYSASIISCSILGYLEIGISSPTPEWGRMVADYFHLIQVRPFLVLIPCVFTSVSVICVMLIAHGLRDALDPKEISHE